MSIRPHIPSELPLKLDLEPIIGLLTSTHSSLARYDGRLEGIPNPAILLSSLITKEAVLSSKIEGTQATLEEVLEFEADPEMETAKDADIREVINYREAMWEGAQELLSRPMSLNLIKRMHSTLLDQVRGHNKTRGEFRKTQNWIGKENAPIEQARFVPTEPANVLPALDKWEKYYHSNDKDLLVQLAIVHAQFEIIHPFIDGNGRIGRILVPLFLSEKSVLTKPMFYISAFFEETRQEYYDRLLAITSENDWMGWITYFLSAVDNQAKRNSEQARKILDLYAGMKEQITFLTRSQFSIQILDFLFGRPIFRSSMFGQQSKIPKPSVARLISCLVKGGVIQTIRPGKGRRSAIYAFQGLLDIIHS